jgi:hypothetical protein
MYTHYALPCQRHPESPALVCILCEAGSWRNRESGNAGLSKSSKPAETWR